MNKINLFNYIMNRVWLAAGIILYYYFPNQAAGGAFVIILSAASLFNEKDIFKKDE